MGLKIDIELTDEDLERFRAMFNQARRVVQTMEEKDILGATRELIEEASSKNPEGFIRERIDGLGKLVAMVEDEGWKLPEELREPIIRALAYFVNPDDLIPDQTPGLGFLDDAIAAELVLRELAEEIQSYDEFCHFRSTESKRRGDQGFATDLSREDWLADQRTAIQARLRERRRRTSLGGGWRTVIFS